MSFKPITNERLSDKVVGAIMQQIESGELRPGDKLPTEPELAEELGVSRGILREALTVLQARNFIIRKPKEGTFVNDSVDSLLDNKAGISLKEATYLDLLEMRACIEQRVVEKIIDVVNDDIIRELTELVNTTDPGDKPNSPDYYFHYRLAELSKNAMFVNFIDTYYDVIDELTMVTIKKSTRREEIRREHMSIVDAIARKDKQSAKDAVVAHLTIVKENIRGIR